jgi:hypothetical protein
MLSWQVGPLKITRIVEMDLPVPAMVIPQAMAAELRKSAWLYPHFVGEDDTLKLSIHALLVEAPGLKLVVDTCRNNGVALADLLLEESRIRARAGVPARHPIHRPRD